MNWLFNIALITILINVIYENDDNHYFIQKITTI
jgi:hypothetical protein